MNVAETGAESKLRMESLCFTELHFTRAESDINDLDLKLKVTRDIKQTSKSEYKIMLSVRLSDDNNLLNVNLTALGIFSLADPNELPSDKLKKIISTNTIAIMFPYVRSQLSLLTTQPNLTPVVLSSMNINALLEEQDSEM